MKFAALLQTLGFTFHAYLVNVEKKEQYKQKRAHGYEVAWLGIRILCLIRGGTYLGIV